MIFQRREIKVTRVHRSVSDVIAAMIVRREQRRWGEPGGGWRQSDAMKRGSRDNSTSKPLSKTWRRGRMQAGMYLDSWADRTFSSYHIFTPNMYLVLRHPLIVKGIFVSSKQGPDSPLGSPNFSDLLGDRRRPRLCTRSFAGWWHSEASLRHPWYVHNALSPSNWELSVMSRPQIQMLLIFWMENKWLLF